MGKADAMSYETFKIVYKEREEYEKTHPVTSSKSKSYTPKCPTCGSGNIEKISVTRKIFFLGPFFPMYGKTFKCKNCGYKW
jgi:C4-type Zn-finger protein